MINMETTIWKRDTKGNVRYLAIATSDDLLIQTSGIFETTKPIVHSKVCTPKNVGKSNATTGEQQAIKQAQALEVKKLQEGYFATYAEARDNEVILPMLAKSEKGHIHKVDWTNAYVQPKLDGMRCLDIADNKISRKNVAIKTMDHIKVVRPKGHDVIVDGELYAHGYNFQENMRFIKKLGPDTTKVKFHVYDVVKPGMKFRDRNSLVKAIAANSPNLEYVPTFKVNSIEEVKQYHKIFLADGYEGTMIRWGDDGYKINGRSDQLLKFKDFIDIDCKIISIGPAKNRPTWARPVVEYKGKQFVCSLKMSHADKEEMLLNAHHYIGTTAEVRFFEFSENGIPRFPVCVGIRLDK